MIIKRDSMEYDVAIVGAGPAGLAAAIRLRQLAGDKDYRVCVLEKGAEVGAHILSGAVIETQSLEKLLPALKNYGVAVEQERFLFLSQGNALSLPTALLPGVMRNRGNRIVSLANLCRRLAEEADALGAEIYPGFAAAEVLYRENGAVAGVVCGDMGLDKQGNPKPQFVPGMEIRAKYTLFAEGVRGFLSQQVMRRFDLCRGRDPQTYGLGIKELWEVDAHKHHYGMMMHTLGYPLDSRTYGGGFVYYQENNQVAVGFVIGLDYANPYLSPYEIFQQFKQHPAIRALLEGGRRIAYGAKALNEGGWQSMPRLTFPGGALLGCAAGMVNVPKVKGIHYAIDSGIFAAESLVQALGAGREYDKLRDYAKAVRHSPIYRELRQARNIRPAFARWGMLGGLPFSALELKLLGGRTPWTLHHRHADHEMLGSVQKYAPPDYPKADGKISFERLSSVYLSGTAHEEDQPVHLHVRDKALALEVNLLRYDGPEQRYCPGGVYEWLERGGEPYLQINAGNCLHCKTCDIKDPRQNIEWQVPEGGGGPNYPNM